MEKKNCPDCNETKPTSQFYKNAGSSDGLQWICKLCSKERSRIARQNNKEKNHKSPDSEVKKSRKSTSDLVAFKIVTVDDVVEIGELLGLGLLYFKNNNGMHKINTGKSVGTALASGCLYRAV